MNEVSQRLQQKMKQFSEIDRQISKTSQGKHKEMPQEIMQSNRQADNNKNKLLFPANKEALCSNFDRIYSNFNEFTSRNKKMIKPIITTDQFISTKTKTETKTKEAQQKEQQQQKQTQLKFAKEMITNYTFKRNSRNNGNESKEKKPPLMKPKCTSSVGNRLYNYGYYLKNKIEFQKRIEEQEMYEKMKPKITKSIIDWNQSSPLVHKSVTKEYRNRHQRVLPKESECWYTYKPSINPNSLAIAKRLEPSYNRLMRKKKKYLNSNINNKSNSKSYSSIELSYDWRNFSYSNTSKSKSPSKTPPKRIRKLYAEGMSHLKERKETYEKNKNQKDSEYKYYSFKPKISPSHSPSASHCTPKEHYTEQSTWKKKIDRRNQSVREKKESELNTLCTFLPNITPLGIENDENMILRNISQTNDYVNKRRLTIQRTKEQEDYKKKRLGNNSGFQIKTTIPKEFAFKTRSRSKSNLRCYSNESNSLFNNNKSYSPKNVLYMRGSLGTENFFQMNSYCHYPRSINHENGLCSVNAKNCLIDDITSVNSRINNMNL